MSSTHTLRLSCAVCGAISLSACGAFSSVASENPYGVQELVPPELVDKIDLIKLLDPLGKMWISPTMPPEEQLGRALTAFYTLYGDMPEDLIRRRNGVQERIMLASSQLATEYEKFLKRSDTASNFSFGVVTTTLAGLGSIFTSASTVRALAGSAAITSGARAEWNENMFQNVTVQLLVKGIRERRTKLYNEIVKRRTGKSVQDYTVEQAIKDAIEFHGAFNLVVGLEESAIALDRVRDPGVNQLRDILGQDIVRRGLGLPEEPAASTSVTDLVNRLDASVQPRADVIGRANDRADAALRAARAFSALNSAPVGHGTQISPTALTIAQGTLTSAADALRAAMRTEADKDPSVDTLVRELSTLGVDVQRLTGDARLKANEKLRIAQARAEVKVDQLQRFTTGQADAVDAAAKAVVQAAESLIDDVANELSVLRTTFVQTNTVACDAARIAVGTLPPGDPNRGSVIAAAWNTFAQSDQGATQIEKAIATVVDVRSDVEHVTKPLRSALHELKAALDALPR